MFGCSAKIKLGASFLLNLGHFMSVSIVHSPLSGVFFPFRISDDFPGGGYVHQDGRGNPRHKCGDESVGRATAGVEAKEGRADGVVP